MAPRLDGPRLEPASGGLARQLVVLLHGYGADGNDLIALARHWQALLPHAAFASPNAPEPCDAGFGFQWFELTMRDPDERWRGVQEAAPALTAFLDAELARLSLREDSLALVGFSQGTMMALHVGLRRAPGPAAILGYSGLLAGPEHLAAEIEVAPPVMLIHGDRDELIPVQALHQARETLAAAGLVVEWHVRPGLGHGIDPEGLALGGAFLAGAFQARLGGKQATSRP